MKILDSYQGIAKELIKESAWDRKFGEPLPTLQDVMNEVDDDKIIKYKKKDGEQGEMKASSAKTMPDDHPAKQAYNKMKGDDDSGEKDSSGKLGGSDFERPGSDDKSKGDDEPKGEPEEKQSDNDVADLAKKDYSELMDMDVKDLDDAVEEGEREAKQLDSEIEDLVKKHNEEFPSGQRPQAIDGFVLPRERQQDKELYDRYKESMDAINAKKERREDVKGGISRISSIADSIVMDEKKNDAVGALESDGVDAIIDKFKEAGKGEIYIDDDEGNEHEVVYDDLSSEMQKQLRDKLKPQYDKVKAAKDKMDSFYDVDEPGYDDAEQAYELAVDAADGMETYDFEQMFDFVTERKGESIKVINGKKYKPIRESKEPTKPKVHPFKETYKKIGGK